MEKILYFDCFAGISGDMTIAALLDLGLSKDAVIAELDKLGVSGFHVEITKTNRFSITGTDVKVHLSGDVDCSHQHHGHGHEEEFSHHHNSKERSLTDISHIINSSDISERAKKLAIAVFTEIAKAEAEVHGKSVGEVHFHEVGAVDSIVDIVGTAICVDMLDVDQILCSPVHEGHGFINCQHGRLPVPVPAVVQMLENSGISIVAEDIEAELVTPTGFGILKTLKEDCGRMPQMYVDKVGYGFGKTETGSLNALRVVLGHWEAEQGDPFGQRETDVVSLLETNLDDCTGEVLGYVMERLFAEGALDVYFTPIFTKKNRPAVALSVMGSKKDTERLSQVILCETGTLGVRVTEIERFILPREWKRVTTPYGQVRVKKATIDGKEYWKPEFSDCAEIARKEGIPLRRIMEFARREIE